MVENLRTAVRGVQSFVPGGVLRYVLPLAGLAGLLGVAYVSYFVLGIHIAIFYGFLYVLLLILLLGSAWLGYGPGILICAIVTLVLPHLRPGSARGAGVDLSRFVLVLIISLLVSRMSQTSRRREEDLRRAAG